jgi:hypothetical protein
MLTAQKGAWYLTAIFLKKAAVLLSILLSAVALALGAFASLGHPSASRMRGMFLHTSISFLILPIPPSSVEFLTTEQHAKYHTRTALMVSSIIVNAVSISLSALTSLDWQKRSTHEKKFADMLAQAAHLHVERMSNGQANVVITNKYEVGLSGTLSSRDLDTVDEGQGTRKKSA